MTYFPFGEFYQSLSTFNAQQQRERLALPSAARRASPLNAGLG